MATSSTPCHTCRRRRVKCDGSLPSCDKCRQSKHECLGYNKLILWNRGIASRGKMMNKTFTDDKPQPTANPVSAPPAHPPSSTSGKHSGESLTLYKSLIDPHFQGLSGPSQFYLHYFGTELSKSYVIYDDPIRNPFRQSVSYTAEHGAFREIVIANSAMHAFRKLYASNTGSQDRQTPVPNVRPAQSPLHYPITNPYQDALIAKQRAIRLLAQGIDQGTLNTDVVFGCVLLFVTLSFLHADQNEVQVHQRGLREVLKNPSITPFTKDKALRIFCNSFLTDIALYDALETALFPSRAYNTPLYSSQIILFENADEHHHFACPWEIVRATIKIADLSKTAAPPSRNVRDEIRFCVDQVEALDVSKWAALSPASSPPSNRTSTSGRLGHIERRMHIAEAYKSAFHVFAARLLRADPCLQRAARSHLGRIVHHLSLVPAADDGFKATSWPAFVAGLESEEHATGAWALAHLRGVCATVPWAYVWRAAETVERTVRARFTAEGGLAEPGRVELSRQVMAGFPVIQHGWQFAV